MPQVAVAAVAAAAAYGASAAAVAADIGIVAGSLAATAIGSAAGLAVSLAGSALIAQGAAKAPAAVQAADRKQAVRSGVMPKNVVYGISFVSGPVAFMASSGEANEFLHLVIPLAAHPIDGFDSLLLNNYFIDVNTAIVAGGGAGAGFVGRVFITIPPDLSSSTGPIGITTVDTADYPGYGSDPKNGYIQANLYDGTQTDADPDLIADLPALWTSNHKLLGLPYVYLKIFFSPDVFSGGFQSLAALVRGKRLRDIRDDTTAFSSNYALCVLDFLQSDYGLAAPDDEIDTDFWIAAANLSDESVAIDVAATMHQPRYTVNGAFALNQTPIQVIDQLNACGAGTLTYVQGKYRLYPAAYDAPTETVGVKDFAGKVSLTTRTPLKDQFNTITGTYIEPQQFWTAVAFPQVEDSAAVTEDGATISIAFDLPFITDAYRAQRLARLHLLLARAGQVKLTADFKYNMLRAAAWDAVTMSLPAVGWSSQILRIENWKFDPVAGQVTAVMHAEAAAAYAWTASDAAEPIIAPTTTLVSPANLPAPADPVVTPSYGRAADGTIVPDLLVGWAAGANPFIISTEIQWKLHTDSDWGSLVVPMPALQFAIIPVLPTIDYDVRIRFVGGLVRGPWSNTVTTTAVGKTATPSNPTGGSLTAVSGGYVVAWTLPPHSTDPDFHMVVVVEQLSPYGGLPFTEAARVAANQAWVLTPGDTTPRAVGIGSADRSGNVASYDVIGNVTPL